MQQPEWSPEELIALLSLLEPEAREALIGRMLESSLGWLVANFVVSKTLKAVDRYPLRRPTTETLAVLMRSADPSFRLAALRAIGAGNRPAQGGSTAP